VVLIAPPTAMTKAASQPTPVQPSARDSTAIGPWWGSLYSAAMISGMTQVPSNATMKIKRTTCRA
jgi:hypothetical protein